MLLAFNSKLQSFCSDVIQTFIPIYMKSAILFHIRTSTNLRSNEMTPDFSDEILSLCYSSPNCCLSFQLQNGHRCECRCEVSVFENSIREANSS